MTDVTLGQGDNTFVYTRGTALDQTITDFGSIYFTVDLDGSQPPTPTGSTATGTGTGVLNHAQDRFELSYTLSGIDIDGNQTMDAGDDLTTLHIHNAPAGSGGPVVFGMVGPNSDQNGDLSIDPVAGSVFAGWDAGEGNNTTLTAQLGNLLSDRLYVNVHTEEFRTGEIRGQLLQADEGDDRIDISALGISDFAELQTLITTDTDGNAVIETTFDGAVTRLVLEGLAPGDLEAGDFIFASAAGTSESGTGNADDLFGGGGGDTLSGLAGEDLLAGGTGNDLLDGGADNDTLAGGSSRDTLMGGDGDDVLDGGINPDTLDGGAGIDTADYSGFDSAVSVNLNITTEQATGAPGGDTLLNIENLAGGAGNDRFTGTPQANLLEGGDGTNLLAGLGGDDTLTGGAGRDQLLGGNGADALSGAGGRDVLSGNAGADSLAGGDDVDQLRGGAGADRLTGGAGRDVLIGGDAAGGFPGDGAADTFVFETVSDSAAGGATRDIIRDFEQGLDLIDLSAIDPGLTFVGAAAFSGTAGEVRSFVVNGNTVVRADVDGDGAADLEIFVNGALTLTASDFVL